MFTFRGEEHPGILSMVKWRSGGKLYDPQAQRRRPGGGWEGKSPQSGDGGRPSQETSTVASEPLHVTDTKGTAAPPMEAEGNSEVTVVFQCHTQFIFPFLSIPFMDPAPHSVAQDGL